MLNQNVLRGGRFKPKKNLSAAKRRVETPLLHFNLAVSQPFPLVTFTYPLFSECLHYKNLTKFDRAKGYKGVAKCDRSLSRGWYRFQGLAGKQMPDACVPKQRCGTHAPGWLRGGHPTVTEGAVKRKVCFHWSSGCCQLSTNIRVRNCGAFFVYKLSPPPACSLRYCGDREQGIILRDI